MIPLLPLAATAILFYPSASPSLLAKSVIDESSQGSVSASVDDNQQVLDAYRAQQSDVIVEHVSGVVDGLREGDRISVKGEYEWNDRGGLVHWTHHDPRNVHEGGWIDHNGLRYQ